MAVPPPAGVGVWKATAIAVGGVAALLLLGAVAVGWRRNRLRAAEPFTFTPPDPNGPYAYREPW